MIREITCVCCPVGCKLRIEVYGAAISHVQGNRCPRGEAYAKEELTNPKRILTTSVKVVDGEYPLVSVRTDQPIPKQLIFDVMRLIRNLSVRAPVEIGQVLLEDILGTGARLIATRTVRACSLQERTR